MRGVAGGVFDGVAVLCAWMVCVSRVTDNQHHPVDVVAGALLGCSLAALNAVGTIVSFYACTVRVSPFTQGIVLYIYPYRCRYSEVGDGLTLVGTEY